MQKKTLPRTLFRNRYFPQLSSLKVKNPRSRYFKPRKNPHPVYHSSYNHLFNLELNPNTYREIHKITPRLCETTSRSDILPQNISLPEKPNVFWKNFPKTYHPTCLTKAAKPYSQTTSQTRLFQNPPMSASLPGSISPSKFVKLETVANFIKPSKTTKSTGLIKSQTYPYVCQNVD